MKLPKILTVVLGTHLGIIALLLFQPGCQHPQSQTSAGNDLGVWKLHEWINATRGSVRVQVGRVDQVAHDQID